MDFSLQQMAKSSEVQAHLLLSNCIMADLRSNKCSSITEFIRRGAVGDGQPLLRVDYDRSQPGPCQTAQRSERNKMAGGLEVHSILHSSQLSFCLVIVAMASSLTRLHSLTKCTTSLIVTGPQTSLPLLHHSHFTCSPLLTPPLPLLTSPTPSSPLTHTFLITLIPPHSHLPRPPDPHLPTSPTHTSLLTPSSLLTPTSPPPSLTVNIAVQHMQVLLEMDFLYTLKDFADEILSSGVYIARSSQSKGDVRPSAEKQPRSVKPAAVNSSSHVSFKVEHPYIALLAKTESGNEDALLVKV